MKSPKRLLILEDDPFYAELLIHQLTQAWPQCAMVTVANEPDFKAALKKDTYDVVLSDYVMPHFNGLTALAVAREQCPGIPFVIASGTIGDEVAVESLKAGATDYVLKDRTARLVPAIRRALRDVEESYRRRQAEIAHQESEALKSAIMDAALDCIIVFDEAGRIVEFNPAAVKTFGYPHSEVIGQLFAETVMPPPLRKQQCEKMLESVAEGNESLLARRMEITGMRADRSEFPLEWAIVPIDLKDRHLFTAYLRDITERKHAEEKVRQVQAKLEESNRDLMRRNEEIQSFYHTLSHELKTPLTSAREFVSIVMDELAGPITPTQAEYLGIAKESCDQLRRCVNDLMDATRLETGKLTLELKPVLPTPFLQRAITSLSLKAAEKGIVLVDEVQADLPEMLLDEHRIAQVMTNLLNNAINYTPANGRITVRAREEPGRPEWLQISVSDTGRGIPEAELDRVFDRLYQVKSGDAASERGIGLGLYLCRELVQLHGGIIRGESQLGKGSTFYFSLPRNQDLLRSSVLLMDGNKEFLETTRKILSLEYNVRTANDGVEGLKEMQRRAPDVVLLDLAMPNLDGPGTLREIRKNWGTTIPIVVVYSAYSGGELMKQAMEFSPFILLAKPCPAAQVLDTVRRMLRSASTTIWNKRQRSVAG